MGSRPPTPKQAELAERKQRRAEREQQERAARRQRQEQEDAFRQGMRDRLRKYIEELGGPRQAARMIGVSPGTVSGWLRDKQPSIPDSLQLVRLCDLRTRSLDAMVGRDAPKWLTVARSEISLADDLRKHVELSLLAGGMPVDEMERHLRDDVLERAVELLRRDVQDRIDDTKTISGPVGRLNRARREQSAQQPIPKQQTPEGRWEAYDHWSAQNPHLSQATLDLYRPNCPRPDQTTATGNAEAAKPTTRRRAQ